MADKPLKVLRYRKRWMYQKVKICDEWIREAEERGKKLGVLKNSITSGLSNVYGMLGERVVAHVVKGKLIDSRDFDVLSPTGAKLEVKSKKCLHAPRHYFECSCALFNTHQRCDAYVFVRILRDCSYAFLCGWLPKKEFLNKSRRLKKGDYDPRNKYTVKASCLNVEMKILRPVTDLLLWNPHYFS